MFLLLQQQSSYNNFDNANIGYKKKKKKKIQS